MTATTSSRSTRGAGPQRLANDSDAYTPAARAGDILAVLDGLGITRTYFWGYSIGGNVGLGLAARAPDRLLSLTAEGANPYHHLANPTDHDPYRWLGHGMEGFVEPWEHNLGPVPAGARERWLAADATTPAAAWIALQRPEGFGDALPLRRHGA